MQDGYIVVRRRLAILALSAGLAASVGSAAKAEQTPAWLKAAIHRIASNAGDPQPDKVAVNLHVVDRYGRHRIRVWMRGQFTVPAEGLGKTGIWHVRLIGVTLDAKTHQTVSWSERG